MLSSADEAGRWDKSAAGKFNDGRRGPRFDPTLMGAALTASKRRRDHRPLSRTSSDGGRMLAGLDGLRFQHWRAESAADGIVVLSFDRAGESVNTLAQDVLLELDGMLERLALDPPKGVVVRSAKPAGFIAGADIHEFAGASTRRARSATRCAAASRCSSGWRNCAAPRSPRSTATAWAAAPNWRWPAGIAWRRAIRRPASACPK